MEQETITKEINSDNFKLRAAYLEDLNPVVEIYRKSNVSLRQNAELPLTEEFGIPVYLAELNKKIVGCLLLQLVNSEVPTIQVTALVDKEFEHTELAQMLSNVAVERLNKQNSKLYDNGTQLDRNQSLVTAFGFEDVQHFKGAVYKLVRWLNLCY